MILVFVLAYITILNSVATNNFHSLKNTLLDEEVHKKNHCPNGCHCIFDQDEMRMTQCRRNNLTELPSDIDENVRMLDLAFNNFNGIPRGIEKLLKLYELDLSHNGYIRIVETDSKNEFLNRLLLKKCSIAYIDSNIFKNFPKLEILDVSENTMTYLNNTLISKSLKSIDLSKCNLKHLNPDYFTKVESLIQLKLSENHNLRYLNCRSQSLVYLDISNCNLERVPTGYLGNVKELDLHGNDIESLKNRSFSNITKVENLNMSFNAIRLIDSGSLSNMDNLMSLDLSFNRLTNFEKNTFDKLVKLESLFVSHNYIREIEAISSTSLKLLELNFCEIQTLSRHSIEQIPSLKELYLRRNQIIQIPDHFEGHKLRFLDISYNYITSINNITFANMKYLRFLVLSGNKLTTLDPKFFFHITELSIDNNPWLCDCASLKPLFDWMKKTGQNSDQIVCQLPFKQEGHTLEEVCKTVWNKPPDTTKNIWWYSISFILTISMLFFLVYISKKIDQHRKNQLDRENEERRAQELADAIQRQQIRDRLRHLEDQEESRNAPDPRELESPPTYNQALMMPRLDASHPSLTGSQHSLRSGNESNEDISKRKKLRMKRRRRAILRAASLARDDETDDAGHLEESSL